LKVQKYAGRLKNYLNEWKKITSDKVVLSAIEGYKIPFLCNPMQCHASLQPLFSEQDNSIIDSLIAELNEKGAIVATEFAEVKFVSKIFIVTKASGGHRLILNLKDLNEFIVKEHFKMEDYRSVCNIISNNCFMGVLDLKDAYHLIPVYDRHQYYLCFRWRDKYYRYTCVPFGLSCAPRLFTKIMKPVLGYLRAQNLESVGFLDDFLLKANDSNSCNNNIKITMNFLESLGWIINFKKSVLVPTQRVTYLGFIFDSRAMSIELPEKKRTNVLYLCENLVKLNFEKSLDCLFAAQVIGTLVSVCPAVPYGELYVRQLEFEKQMAVCKNSGSFEGAITLSDEAIIDATWWITKIGSTKRVLTPESYKLVVTTDASLSGW